VLSSVSDEGGVEIADDFSLFTGMFGAITFPLFLTEFRNLVVDLLLDISMRVRYDAVEDDVA
jgi:hypothetical protein